MRRLLIAVAFVLCLAGCNLQNDQQIQAHQRWNEARARVLVGIGNEHLKVGELNKAQSSAREALTLDPAFVPAQILLGKALLEKGRYIEAAERLQEAEKTDATNPEIAYLVGVAMEKVRRYEEALSSYQKARALDPSNSAYVTASAEVLVAMGRIQAALELLQARLERADPDAGMLALAGKLAMLNDQPAQAAQYYQRSLDMDPKNTAVREELAKAQFFAGAYPEALLALKVLCENPEYRDKVAWVYLLTGHCHLELGQLRQARSAYETATHIDPDDPVGWVALAKASLMYGDPARAAMAARQALSLTGEPLPAEDEPQRQNLRLAGTVLLGYALLREGKQDEAVRLLASAVRHRPNDPVLQCALGRAYAALGQTDKAVGCYVQALRADPDNRLAKTLLASRSDGQDRSDPTPRP